MKDRLEARARRMEEAAVELYRRALNKPGESASSYDWRQWHKDLLVNARAYGRAVHNLARKS